MTRVRELYQLGWLLRFLHIVNLGTLPIGVVATLHTVRWLLYTLGGLYAPLGVSYIHSGLVPVPTVLLGPVPTRGCGLCTTSVGPVSNRTRGLWPQVVGACASRGGGEFAYCACGNCVHQGGGALPTGGLCT